VRNHPSHSCILKDNHISTRGPGSSVGIATGYGLEGPGSNTGGGARFSAPIQTARGPPSLLDNGYRDFPGGKGRPGRDADPLLPSSAVATRE